MVFSLADALLLVSLKSPRMRCRDRVPVADAFAVVVVWGSSPVDALALMFVDVYIDSFGWMLCHHRFIFSIDNCCVGVFIFLRLISLLVGRHG